MTHPATTTRRTAGMLTSGFAELTLEVRDRERMERFYVRALDLEVLAREDDRTWLGAGGHARLGLWLPGKKEYGDEGGRHVHFAFSAAPGGLDEVVARLVRLGVAHRGPVEHEGGDRSVYAEDPEGNVLEVWDFFERREGRHGGVEALADDAASVSAAE
jgi:catechol-2,3-dioxygenase